MSDLRNLAETKLGAALQASIVPSDKSMLETPTALAATKSYLWPLVCGRTGITVGSLTVATVAGHLPMLGQWKETMVLHPVFSLSPGALLKYSRNTWFRFCAFTVDEGADDKITAAQEKALQVAALAILHTLANVRQDVVYLPSWPEVSANWTSLLALGYWKAYLDSERFRFPEIHISKYEQTIDLHGYLQSCWAVKKNYETRVNEKIEMEKLRAADAALVALRNDLVGAKPTSIRQLWRWYCASVSTRYAADLEGWMHTIFFSKGEEIRAFTMADIDMFETIFLSECPTGSSISHAFSEVLASKRKYLQQHFEAFEIIIPESIIAAKAAGEISLVEPKLSEYPTKVKWMIAHAKWKLAHTNMGKALEIAGDKQSSRTVNPSFIPELPLLDRQDDEEQEDEIDIDAIDAADRDDTITGDKEDN